MAAATAGRHETGALLRAHLAAASGYRHLTRHCPICHRLLRLAMEPQEPAPAPDPAHPGESGPTPARKPADAAGGGRGEDEGPDSE
ncbi:DUF6274 family protein [Streptomyces sp. NPDC020141]|uniref:DUF6274 family protein n=1 Tax=Streptomyces sp. NPDC020141 TaxID=3365065 RepID=UPI0037A3AD50